MKKLLFKFDEDLFKRSKAHKGKHLNANAAL